LNSPSDEITQKIITKLAEYISTQTNDASSVIPSSAINTLVDQLSNKLNQSEVDLTDDDLNTLGATAKIFLKNLPVIINAIVSNIDIVRK
jgi:hypothetical protein